jgi:hypothetical protein
LKKKKKKKKTKKKRCVCRKRIEAIQNARYLLILPSFTFE